MLFYFVFAVNNMHQAIFSSDKCYDVNHIAFNGNAFSTVFCYFFLKLIFWLCFMRRRNLILTNTNPKFCHRVEKNATDYSSKTNHKGSERLEGANK